MNILLSTGELFHFQAWKRGSFYQFTTRSPSHDTHALLITTSGFIPLKLHPSPVMLHANNPVPSLQHLLQQHYHQATTVPYADYETSYCKQFKANLKSCEAQIWPRDVEVMSFESAIKQPASACRPEISLVVATSALHDDVFSGVLEESLLTFEGDQVGFTAVLFSFCFIFHVV